MIFMVMHSIYNYDFALLFVWRQIRQTCANIALCCIAIQADIRIETAIGREVYLHRLVYLVMGWFLWGAMLNILLLY